MAAGGFWNPGHRRGELLTAEGTAGLIGWLPVDRQAELEYGAPRVLAGVPDLVFAIAALAVLALIGLPANRNRAGLGG